MKLVAYLSTALTEQLNILQKKSFSEKMRLPEDVHYCFMRSTQRDN